MGEAVRRRRAAAAGSGSSSARRAANAAADPREAATAALTRLVRLNRPDRVSLAGAYAFGYGALGMAQQDGDGPGRFDELDPLDTLFLCAAFPGRFRDGYDFGNARTAHPTAGRRRTGGAAVGRHGDRPAARRHPCRRATRGTASAESYRNGSARGPADPVGRPVPGAGRGRP
jgi:hypothetical protein